jgi:hypothetical protein
MDPIRDSVPTYLEYFGVALVVSAIVGTLVWFVVRYVRRRHTREVDEIVPLVRDEEAPLPRPSIVMVDPSHSMIPPWAFECTRKEDEAVARRLNRAQIEDRTVFSIYGSEYVPRRFPADMFGGISFEAMYVNEPIQAHIRLDAYASFIVWMQGIRRNQTRVVLLSGRDTCDLIHTHLRCG